MLVIYEDIFSGTITDNKELTCLSVITQPYIAPEFKIYDRAAGQIDAANYSFNIDLFNLQVPDVLRFEFLNENDLLIYDDTNGTVTEAYNFSDIVTSRTSQNIIIAGEGRQSFNSYGPPFSKKSQQQS